MTHPERDRGPDTRTLDAEAEVAERYFSSFAADYHQAFEGRGRQFLHLVINRAFRQKTFTRRTDIVRAWLQAYGVGGKEVLDVGCGSGEVSLVAARLGARVTGLDISPEMIAIARQEAAAAGLDAACSFEVTNFVSGPLQVADVLLLVGVIEYYRDLDLLLPRVCAAAREMIVIVDTRGPWWRRTLRHFLAWAKHFHLYYHPPAQVIEITERSGFTVSAQVAGHSFTAMLFRRRPARA